MKTYKLLLFLIFFIISGNVFSQDKKIDKLIEKGKEISYINLDSSLIFFNKALNLSIEKEEKEYESLCYGEIGKIFYYKNEIDSASDYFQKSLDIAIKIDDNIQAAKMYNNLGQMNLFTQNYEKAIELYKKQLIYSLKANDSTWISDSYNNFGSYFMNIDMFDSAVFYYEKALNIALTIDYKNNIGTVNTNLAIIYHTKGNFPLSLKYYFNAANIFEETEDYGNLAVTYANIGALYLDNEDYTKAKEFLTKAYNMHDTVVIAEYYLQINLINLGIVYIEEDSLDKAELFLKNALEISTKNEDQRTQIITYLNIVDLYIEKEEYNKALEYANICLSISEEINSEQYIASSYKKIGQVYNKLGDYNKAIKMLKIAYKKSLELDYLTYIIDVLNELKYAYSNTRDYQNAFETNELIIMYKDSLTGIETKKEISNLTALYEVEKKEQQIEKQKLEITAKNLKIKQSNTRIIAALAVLTLLIILSIVLITSIKAKKKTNRILREQKEIIEQKNEELGQLVEEISTQKDEIEVQRDIANEQKAEIIASINYAQKIQNAVLPSTEAVKQILNEHFILFKPRDIVSGDFYWIKKIKNNIIVATADCTGHGVPGAFMSMLGSAFLNEIVTAKSTENPSKILNELRHLVKKSLKQKGENKEQKDGMDIALYTINEETLELKYSGAYNPLFIIRNNRDTEEEFIILKADRQPIAIHISEKDFTTQTIQLQKNDCLYTFSDGFIDQFGGDNNTKYLSKNFKNLLSSIYTKPMQEQQKIIEKELIKWKGEISQTDDILIIGVRI